MQIDSRNYRQVLPIVLDQLVSAEFIAFDCEFTGLITQQQRIEGSFADYRQFYQRIKETALNFKLLQLGITTFVYTDGNYCPSSFNFYVRPTETKPGFSNVVVCQVDSLQFLAENRMDFTTAFRYGIPTRRLYEIAQPVQNKPSQQQETEVIFGSEDQKIVEEIQSELNTESNVHHVDFRSKTIYNYLRSKYLNMSLDKKNNMKGKFEYLVKFYKRTDEIVFAEGKVIPNQQKKQEKQPELQQLEKQEEFGLERIIETMIKVGKPIIGHFPNLDLALIYHAFLGNIPATYEEYCERLLQKFPLIFDTKIISRRLQSSLKNLKVDLKSLFQGCFNPKLLQPYTNIDYKNVEKYLKGEGSHEAGYDSCITGCAFIGMSNYLAGRKGLVDVNVILEQQCLLYSRFTGGVSLRPPFTTLTKSYNARIMIHPAPKALHDWQSVGKVLSNFGTLTIHQDQQETYYVFEQQQDINGILSKCAQLGLKTYEQRRIILARDMYTTK